MREDIMTVLTDEAEGFTVAEVAAALEASKDRVRKELKALVADGKVEVTDREGEKAQVFVLTPPEPPAVEVGITHRTRSEDRDVLAFELLNAEALTMDDLALRMSEESGETITKKLTYQSIWRLSHDRHGDPTIRKIRTGSRVPLWASFEVAEVVEAVLAEEAEARKAAEAEAKAAKAEVTVTEDDPELATAAA